MNHLSSYEKERASLQQRHEIEINEILHGDMKAAQFVSAGARQKYCL